MPGDTDWTPTVSFFDRHISTGSTRYENAALSGYQYHIAMGLCGACDVRLDCGLAAVDEEPLVASQHLIRGGVTAQKRGELIKRYKEVVAARPAVLYKRKCGNHGCGSRVGSSNPDVLLCFKCRMAPGQESWAA